MVSNIWWSHNLKPHRVKTFKLSRDPDFLEKLTHVVGLYLNPPQQAIVLCVDDKSQIGPCYARHRHQEWLRFLRRLDGEFPGEVALHLVIDNYGS